MWISLIRYWRSGSIWQKCEEEEQAFLLREFLGIKSRSKSKSSDEVGEGVPPDVGLAAAGTTGTSIE
jgi:hypothetical protein